MFSLDELIPDKELRESGKEMACLKMEEERSFTRTYALLDVFLESPYPEKIVEALSKLDNFEALYEITGTAGEFDIVALISASNSEELSDVLKSKILNIRGVKNAISSACPAF